MFCLQTVWYQKIVEIVVTLVAYNGVLSCFYVLKLISINILQYTLPIPIKTFRHFIIVGFTTIQFLKVS